MRFFKLAAVSAVALGVATGAQAACDDGEVVIKFSHVTNTDKHPKGIAASLLQERVNEEMNGKACMEVYPNSTLYDDNKVLEAMLQGDVQLAAPSLSKFEKFTKQFRLFDLPFMFKNIDAVDAFQASEQGQALLDSMQRRGLQGLAYWHNGMKQMSASRPLIKPEDAAGLKFRVQPSDGIASPLVSSHLPSSILSYAPSSIARAFACFAKRAAEARAATADIQQGRIDGLAGDGLASQRERELAELSATSASASLRSARAKVRAAESELATKRAYLERVRASTEASRASANADQRSRPAGGSGAPQSGRWRTATTRQLPVSRPRSCR